MKTVKYDVTYVEGAGRLELFIRFFWLIPTFVVLCVLSFIGTMAYCLQFLYILLLGKRHKTLHAWIVKYMAYVTKVNSYYLLVTDERNPIMPED